MSNVFCDAIEHNLLSIDLRSRIRLLLSKRRLLMTFILCLITKLTLNLLIIWVINKTNWEPFQCLNNNVTKVSLILQSFSLICFKRFLLKPNLCHILFVFNFYSFESIVWSVFVSICETIVNDLSLLIEKWIDDCLTHPTTSHRLIVCPLHQINSDQ